MGMNAKILSAVAVLIMSTSGLLAPPAAPLAVSFSYPPNGFILTNGTLNVSGTASPSNASYVQSTQSDFDAGQKDGVVTGPGEVKLPPGAGGAFDIYDNFNDNSLSASKWTTVQQGSGIAVTESGGQMKLGGTAGSGNWACLCYATSMKVVTFSVAATLGSYAGTGTAHSSHLGIYQDYDNWIMIGQTEDVGAWGSGVKLHWAYYIGGVYSGFVLGAAAGGSHVYSISYNGGTAFLYEDGVQKATKTITLKNPVAITHANARAQSDTVDARWDNVTIDPTLAVLDDFNDNSLDTNKWTTTSLNGPSVTETGGRLQISGTSNSGSYWMGQGRAVTSRSVNIFFADIASFSGTGSGYVAYVGLWVDGSNYIVIGSQYDPGSGIGGNYHIMGKVIGGSQSTPTFGDAGNGNHRYGIVLANGMASVYIDGIVVTTTSCSLTSPKGVVGVTLRDSGDSATMQFDNATSVAEWGLWDDFNDNSIDSGKWSTTAESGFSVTEESQVLRLSGTPTQSVWTNAMAVSSSTVEVVSANITSFSASGTAYSTGLYLQQDSQNSIGLAEHYDWTWGYRRLAASYSISGTSTEVFLGDISSYPYPHNVKLLHLSGIVYCYFNDNLVYQKMLPMTSPKLFIHISSPSNAASLDARWDDVRVPTTASARCGNFTSSVHDTRCPSPVLTKTLWASSTPSGTGLNVSFRSSDFSDMASATSWLNLTNGQTSGFPAAKRYLQYRVALTSDGSGTPVFQGINITYHRPIVKVEASTDNQLSWMRANGTAQWFILLNLPEGQNTIFIRVTDATGDNITQFLNVGVDTEPPVGDVLINDGQEITDGRVVNLTLDATDRYTVSWMKISDNSIFTGADWEPYQTFTTWTLPPGDGLKYVHVLFQDINGWVSEPVYDTILLDTLAPGGTLLIENGTEYARNATVRLDLTVDDTSPGVQMLLANSGDFAGSVWVNFSCTLNWTLQPGNGQRTVFARFRDMFSHLSSTVSDSILLDSSPPVVSVILQNGSAHTRNSTAPVELRALENNRVTHMAVGEDRLLAGAQWIPFTPNFTYSFTGGDGPRTLYARLRDVADNEGAVNSSSITLDTTPPDSNMSGPSTTASPNFTIGWAATDQHSGVQAYDIQYRDGEGAWNYLTARTAQTTHSFSGADGHTYHFRVRAIDRAGNEEPFVDSPMLSVTVSAPTPIVMITSPQANATVNGKLNVQGTSYHPVSGKKVSMVMLYIDGGNWQIATGTANWKFQLDTTKMTNGCHTVTVRAFDGEVYSPEKNVQFTVKNPRDTVSVDNFPYIVLAIIVVIAALGIVGFIATRKKKAPADTVPEMPRPPPRAAVAFQSPPPEQYRQMVSPVASRPVAPPEQHISRVTVVDKISADDLEDEPAVPEETPAKSYGGRTEGNILKSLSSLPRGLPSSLWGNEMDELAGKIASGERRTTEDGEELVKVGNKWYFGDEKDIGTFMQEYKKR